MKVKDIESSSTSSSNLHKKEQIQNISKFVSTMSTNTASVFANSFESDSPVLLSVNDREHILSTDAFSWEFDCLKCDVPLLVDVIWGYFDKILMNTNKSISVDKKRLRNFFEILPSYYNDVPYHNIYHATSVVHFTYMLLQDVGFIGFKPIEVFATLLAAVVHDLDHRGYNNAYEKNTNSSLAEKYKDHLPESPLENHHFHYSWEIIDSKSDYFFLADETQKAEVVEFMKACILGTDMANHNTLVDQLKEAKTRSDLSNLQWAVMIVHVADLNNSVRPFDPSAEWSIRIATEWHQQFLIEREKNLPQLPFMEVTTAEKFCKNELSFINFLTKPLWLELASEKFGLSVRHLVEEINQNLKFWAELKESFEEGIKKQEVKA